MKLLVLIALIGAVGYGWIANIVILAHSNFDHLTGLLILRVCGIFIAPIGSILGFV